MKRIAVLLCGCGHRDGSEIHEATCTILATSRAGATWTCLAPKGEHSIILDHTNGQDMGENRDMLVESARIARGNIEDVAAARVDDFDAVIIPGGLGAAMNLSTFLKDGSGCRVRDDVAKFVGGMVKAGKPVGAVCIAPATLAKILKDVGVSATLTIGTDDNVAARIEQMGHRHEKCPATECVVDALNKVVTTPAYMTAKSIGEVWQGIEKLVNAVIEMA